MNVSVAKTANAVARLHMAVHHARNSCEFSGEILPINDGIFLASKSKNETCNVLRMTMIMLAATFLCTPVPANRFLYRGAIAFGPVVSGADLSCGLSVKKKEKGVGECLERVMIGSPVIQAYQAETNAPPFGIAVHESARAFAGEGDRPFPSTHWLWWVIGEGERRPEIIGDFGKFKEVLRNEVASHLKWLGHYEMFNRVAEDKIKKYSSMSEQYFSIG